MALAQLLSGFQAKGVSYKKISGSPISGLAKGDNYVFATSEDAVLPKSLGFASTTFKELVIIFTCQALSLVENKLLEDYVYEILATLNQELKICVFVFTSRENKYHFHCRASIKEKQDLQINSVWTYLGRIEHEYKEYGKRLKTMIGNWPPAVSPGVGRGAISPRSVLERFLTSDDRYKGQVVDSTPDCTSLSLNLSVTSRLSPRVYQVPAQLKVYQDYATCFVYQEELTLVGMEEMSQAIAQSNSLEIEPIGCLSYISKRDSGVAYKADLVFKFIDEIDLIESVIPKFLFRCGKKYVHRRKLLANARENLLLEVRDTLNTSSTSDLISVDVSLKGIVPVNQELMQNVYDFWNRKKPDSIEMVKDEYFIREDLWPLFDLKHPEMFHASFLMADMLRPREQAQYMKYDYSFEDRKRYFDATDPKIQFGDYRLPKLYENILPNLQIQIAKIKVGLTTEAFPNGSDALQLNSGLIEAIEQTTVIQGDNDLWTISKAFAPFSVSATLSKEAPKLLGYVLCVKDNCINAVIGRLPNLIEMITDSGVDYFRYSLQVLISVAGTLSNMHQRNLFHLQLCPAAVHPRGKKIKLTGMKYSALFLPKLSEIDHFSLQFLAPEVLKVMKNKATWYKRPELVNRKLLERIGPAADVYGFGCLMHWLLDLARSNPPFPHMLDSPDGLVNMLAEKHRPNVSAKFEEAEPRLTDLIYQCWSPKHCRPTMATLRSLLDPGS